MPAIKRKVALSVSLFMIYGRKAMSIYQISMVMMLWLKIYGHNYNA